MFCEFKAAILLFLLKFFIAWFKNKLLVVARLFKINIYIWERSGRVELRVGCARRQRFESRPRAASLSGQYPRLERGRADDPHPARLTYILRVATKNSARHARVPNPYQTLKQYSSYTLQWPMFPLVK